MSFVLIFYHLYGFYEFLFRAEQEFVLLSRVKILYLAGGPVIQVIGVILGGIYGLFFAIIILNVFIFLYLYQKKTIKLVIPKLDVLLPVIRVGIPMMLNGMADILLYTSDRLMILAFLGREELGFYSIAVLGASFIDFIPAAFQNILLPRIMVKRGQNSDSTEMEKYWLEPIKMLSIILPVAVGFIWILAPVAVLILLPKYYPGLFSLKILSFGMCFASIAVLTRNLFTAFNKQFRVLFVFMMTTIIGIALN